jgi:RecJ-like exonuclease
MVKKAKVSKYLSARLRIRRKGPRIPKRTISAYVRCFQHDPCQQCKGGNAVRTCKLCKGSGKARFTSCLCCDNTMVMNNIFNKICPYCQSRPNDVRDSYLYHVRQ